MTPILILAAGASRRMQGRDKLMEDVAGEPLLRLQARRACATGHPVSITLPALDHPRAATFTDLPVTPIVIPDPDEGMAASLRTGVAALPTCDAFLVTLADLVALETADLTTVIAARNAAPTAMIWRGATASGAPGHPILFHSTLRPAFATLKGDTGGATILKANEATTQIVRLPDNRACLDLDTPKDWATWRKSQD